MKNQFFKIITMLYLFILTSCGAALEPPKINTDYKNIIGKPIKIGNIEAAQYDFPKIMNWEDAKKACADLGEGWKLPNNVELNYLYQNRFAFGGFAPGAYWSSTGVESGNAIFQSFFVGRQLDHDKLDPAHIRAIRAF